MLNGDFKRKLVMVASVIMVNLYSSCCESVVCKSEIEAFIDFWEFVNNMRVVIQDYVVKCCGVPFIFRNDKFPCNTFM